MATNKPNGDEQTVSVSDLLEQLDPENGAQALERVMPFLRGISLSEVRKFNIRPLAAVDVGLSYAKSLEEARADFAKVSSGSFNVSQFDNLRDRALAYWHADMVCRLLDEQREPINALMNRAAPLRQTLLSAAISLWSDDGGIGKTVAEINSGKGRLKTANDLVALANLFTSHRNAVSKQCGVTEKDIQQAEEVGQKLMKLLGLHGKGRPRKSYNIREVAGEYLRRGIEEIHHAATIVYCQEPEMLAAFPNPFTNN